MIEKTEFTIFVKALFRNNKIDEQLFESGCIMIDVYINERDVLVLMVEPLQIGIPLIRDYLNYFDLCTISDIVFNSNQAAEEYLNNLGLFS